MFESGVPVNIDIEENKEEKYNEDSLLIKFENLLRIKKCRTVFGLTENSRNYDVKHSLGCK